MYGLADFAHGSFDTRLMARMWALELFQAGLTHNEVALLLRGYTRVVSQNAEVQEQMFGVKDAKEALEWGKWEATQHPELPVYASFYEKTTTPKPYIVNGLIREGQLVMLAGVYGIGKSPLLLDLTVSLIRGLEWLGRGTVARPVVLLDFETDPGAYRTGLMSMAKRLEVEPPKVPEELDVYLERDSPLEPTTKKLLELASEPNEDKVRFLSGLLERKPSALVIIDPIEVFFAFDSRAGREVLGVYTSLRHLLTSYPKAAALFTMNLRKKDRRATTPPLSKQPREWLEDVSGSANILNRSDVRLGIDDYGEEGDKVVHGVRRGEDCQPLVLRLVECEGRLAGFERAPMGELDMLEMLTTNQQVYWNHLPAKFTFMEALQILKAGRSTLHRFIAHAISLSLLKVESRVGRTTVFIKAQLT